MEARSAKLREGLPALPARDRLIDLVRFQRHDLHSAGLISNDEFMALLEQGPAAVKALETYDEIVTRMKQLEERLDRAHEALRFFWPFEVPSKSNPHVHQQALEESRDWELHKNPRRGP